MSVIGGQNIPAINSLAYVIDFGNQRSYSSGSNTVTSLVYSSITGSFTGSIPNLINGILQPSGSTLRTGQTFPGFNFNSGNLTLMFSGEVKNSSPLFTQDGTLAVVATTSSIGYGNSSGSFGRNFPVSGFNHVTLRFTSASVDCYVNGVPVSASGIFPTAPSSSTFTDFKVGGNYLPSAWTGSLSGSIGQLMVYNRQLTDDEIYNDYLIQARRYGLPERVKPYTIDSSAYVYTQAVGITDTTTINAINTFVSGLKSASLWDKMIAIYPFLGADTTKTRYNLKDVSLNTTEIDYSGSWTATTSGSKSNNTSSYATLANIKPTYNHPLISSQSIHLSYLSYDTPVSGGYLMGVEQLPGLPGDIATPAAAYSVRKVRTAYTGSAMQVRRDFDDVTFNVGFDASGNLNTGSLLTNMTASGITTTLPGDYSGLAAAYSLRRVSSSYSGYAIEVQSGSVSQSIGFDAFGNLNTGSLLTFAGSGDAFVKTWYDQSGNNRHANQSATSSQPLIVSSGVIVTKNNKPALSFDGVNDSITMTGLHGQSYLDQYFVTTTSDSKYLYPNEPGNFSKFGFVAETNASTVLYDTYGTASLYANGTLFTGTTRTDVYNFLNGSKIVVHQSASTAGWTQYAFSGYPSAYFYSGSLQELIVFTSSVSSSRGLIEDNINGYYNIFTQSLASSSGYVTQWYDQSGNNNHATQSVAANQPLILSSGSITINNNKPAIQWDGVDDFFGLTTPIAVADQLPLSTFNVYYLQGSGQNSAFGLGSAGFTYTPLRYTDNNLYISVGNYSQTDATLVSSTESGSILLSSILNTSTFLAYLNSNLKYQKSVSTSGYGQLFTTLNKWNNGVGTGKQQELIIYRSNQSSSRQPIEQNINSYFNIYTPVGYNQNLNSLSLFSNPTTVLGAANNLISASFTTGGPLGLITVSRTGSSNYALWKNKVNNKVNITPSTPQTSSFFLSAANVNNLIFSGSQNNIAYASVGAGLTDTEVGTYYDLVDTLQTSLGRGVSNPGAFITTWDTRLTGSGTSNSSSIVLPLYGTQAITASWGDGTTSNISSSTQVERTHSYATPGIYTVTITGSGQGFSFGNTGDKTKLIDIGQWGSISASINNVFQGATNVLGTAADYPPLQTTSLNSFFNGATKFNGNINNWNVVSCSDFSNMFYSATTFNQPLRNWTFATTGSINMATMFTAATSFNQDIGNWNTVRVTNMYAMFFDNGMKFNNGGSDSIKNWNTSNVTNMSYMFWRCTFNQPIGTWNVGNVTNFDLMFWQSAFNQNIGAWNVEKATSMSEMFGYLGFNNSGSNSINNWRPISCSNFSLMFRDSSFNQPIGNWPISASNINMQYMFLSATAFNQNLGSWDVSKVTNMGSVFQSATAFNNSGSNTINNWRPISCSNFSNMFQSATAFNQPVGNWPISASNINMSSMFQSATGFNQNIGAWNVEKVTTMASMFLGASTFNNSGSNTINNWRPISCSSFSSMFQSNTTFNQPIGNWPLSGSNINISYMFFGATAFNQNIGSWDMSRVINPESLFRGATSFNNSGSNSINNWNTSNCTIMADMFSSAISFNQPIGNWNVGNVTDFRYMFNGATSFNQDISLWNMTGATSVNGIRFMFNLATSFNQPIGTWNTSKISTMEGTFNSATSFNQNLGSWLIPSCSNMASMLNSCGMDKANYSATLIGWAAQAPNIKSNVTLGASGRQYDTPGSSSRAILTSAPYNWTITGDTYVP